MRLFEPGAVYPLHAPSHQGAGNTLPPLHQAGVPLVGVAGRFVCRWHSGQGSITPEFTTFAQENVGCKAHRFDNVLSFNALLLAMLISCGDAIIHQTFKQMIQQMTPRYDWIWMDFHGFS